MRYLAILILFLATLKAQAQQELSTHFMQGTWQSNMTNPALGNTQDSNRLIIALPTAYYNFYNTNTSYNDLFVRSEGNTTLNVNSLLNNLQEGNDLRFNTDISTIAVALRLNAMTLSLGHTLRSDVRVGYPKSLAELLVLGNAPYIGQTVEFGPSLNTIAYNEFALGAAYQVSKLTIGAKLKYLNGIGNISTDRQQASLYTDDDVYQLTFNTDYRLQTSAFLDINSLDDINFNFNLSDNLLTKNTGLAFDLGLHFQINNRLAIAASVIDIGGIEWTENAKAYHSQGTYTYEGINLNDFITDEGVDLEVKLDTLETIFNFQESAVSYRTQLPLKSYLSATYQLNDNWSFGGLYYLDRYQEETNHAIALSAQTKIVKILTLGAVYSIRNQEFFNLGLNLECRLGPVQIAAMTDNILGVITLNDSRNLNGRLAINLLF